MRHKAHWTWEAFLGNEAGTKSPAYDFFVAVKEVYDDGVTNTISCAATIRQEVRGKLRESGFSAHVSNEMINDAAKCLKLSYEIQCDPAGLVLVADKIDDIARAIAAKIRRDRK